MYNLSCNLFKVGRHAVIRQTLFCATMIVYKNVCCVQKQVLLDNCNEMTC